MASCFVAIDIVVENLARSCNSQWKVYKELFTPKVNEFLQNFGLEEGGGPISGEAVPVEKFAFHQLVCSSSQEGHQCQ